MTMGIATVACLAERVDTGPAVTIISTGSRTSSAANVRRRSGSAPANRHPMIMFFPSVVAEFAQSLPEGVDTSRTYGTRIRTQISYPRDFLRLLRGAGRNSKQNDSEQ